MKKVYKTIKDPHQILFIHKIIDQFPKKEKTRVKKYS